MPKKLKAETKRAADAGLQAEQLLSRVGQVFSANKSVETALIAVVQLIRAALDLERCSIMLLDRQNGVLKLAAAAGIPESFWPDIQSKVGEGVSGKVVYERKPVFVEDISSSEFAHAAHHERYTTKSFFSVPILVQGEVVGVLNANSRADQPARGRKDLDLLIALSSMIGLNITNAQLAQEAEQSKARLTALADALPWALIEVDRGLMVTLGNIEARRWLGVAPEARLAGRALLELWPQLEGTEALGKLREVLTTGARLATTEHLQFPRDLSAEHEISISPITLRDGQQGALFMFRDLRSSARVDAYKSEFLSLLAHELRTPVAAIQAASQLLLGPPTPSQAENWAQMLRIVSSNTRRLLNVVNSLLDLEEVGRDSLQLHKEVARIDELVREVVQLFEPEANQKHIVLETHTEPITATVDKQRFAQMVAAVVENAIKFSPTQTKVEVMCEGDSNKSFKISVRDAGPGVPKEVLLRYSSLFNQGQPLATRSAGGLGVGLSLVHALARLHGGAFELQEAEGGGTVATITLPLNDDLEATCS
jgi:signal transduction histidine kinase